jgi:CRP/FNR family transcriptional regulator, cyclic AMP receptor protein
MATSCLAVSQKVLEDPLAHLPCTNIVEYPKGSVIYDQEQPASNIYLVMQGKVKVCRVAGNDQVVLDLYQADELFGESALLHLPHWSEQAKAVECTSLMSWTAAEIEEIAEKKPKLAIALLQIVVQRALDLERRIQSFSLDTIGQRLARSLLRLGERFGSPQDDGSLLMVPFTHELLARYVGTSREAITQYMNQFRRLGYITYSRQAIVLKRDGLNNLFRQEPQPSADEEKI